MIPGCLLYTETDNHSGIPNSYSILWEYCLARNPSSLPFVCEHSKMDLCVASLWWSKTHHLMEEIHTLVSDPVVSMEPCLSCVLSKLSKKTSSTLIFLPNSKHHCFPMITVINTQRRGILEKCRESESLVRHSRVFLLCPCPSRDSQSWLQPIPGARDHILSSVVHKTWQWLELYY